MAEEDEVCLDLQAERCLKIAGKIAEEMEDNFVGTQHLLLGILSDGRNFASLALRSLGIDYGNLKEKVRRLVGAGVKVPYRERTLTPGAKKALEDAWHEARLLGEKTVSPEILLLALLREEGAVAARALVKMGVSLSILRKKLLRRVVGLDEINLRRTSVSRN